MKNLPKEWLVLIIIFVLTALVGVSEWRKNSTTTGNTSTTTPADTRVEKEQGDVTVIVEYLPEKSTDNMVFQIALDTHSVNLDAFDFQKDVVLEQNGKESSPTVINQEGSGHHRKAEVSFGRTATPFTIVVRNVSTIPRREFKFENL